MVVVLLAVLLSATYSAKAQSEGGLLLGAEVEKSLNKNLSGYKFYPVYVQDMSTVYFNNK